MYCKRSKLACRGQIARRMRERAFVVADKPATPSSSRFSWTLCLLCCIASSPVSVADDALSPRDRLNLLRPLLRPDPSAPMGRVFRLRFGTEENGRRWLFAAGDDKVVHQWQLFSPESDGAIRLQASEQVHWPVAHGWIGRVRAMDTQTSEDGMLRIAFGGIGYSRSEVHVASLAGSRPLALFRKGYAHSAHAFVRDVAFRPGTRQVAVGYAGGHSNSDAQVLLWDSVHGDVVAELNTGLASADVVRFSPSGGRLAVASSISSVVATWRVTSAGRFEPEGQKHLGRFLSAVDWIDDSTWVAATGGAGIQQSGAGPRKAFRLTNRSGRAVGFQVGDGRQKTGLSAPRQLADGESFSDEELDRIWIALPKSADGEGGDHDAVVIPSDRFSQWEIRSFTEMEEGGGPRIVNTSEVTALAANPRTQRMAFAVYDMHRQRKFSLPPAEVLLETADRRRRFPLQQAGFDDGVLAVALSADGRYLAAAGISEDVQGIQIRLWSTSDGKLIDQVPSSEHTVEGGGAIEFVGIAEPEGSAAAIDFRWKGTTSTNRIRLDDTITFQPSESSTSAGGPHWRIERDRAGNISLAAEQKATLGPFPLTLNNTSPRPQTIASFERGGTHFVAIGYETNILVWDVAAEREWTEQLLRPGSHADWLMAMSHAVRRGFLGHESGRVSCLAVSPDSTWLLSGSDDGTIRAWSLEGIESAGEDQRSGPSVFRSPELGVTFTSREDALFVQGAPAIGTPGWIAGFDDGQKILTLNVGGTSITDRRAQCQLLQNPVPGDNLFVTVRSRNGKEHPLWTTSLHDPLWTLYPVRNGHWIVWTPSSQFYHSGDPTGRDVGDQVYWHVNHGREEDMVRSTALSAETFWSLRLPGRQFRRCMERRPPRIPPTDSFLQPQVTITRLACLEDTASENRREIALDRDAVLEGRRDLLLDVRSEAATVEEIVAAEIWCNGCLVRRELADGESAGMQLSDVAIPRADLSARWPNRIYAITESRIPDPKGGEPIPLSSKDAWEINIEGPPAASRLFYVGAGVTRLAHRDELVRASIVADELRYADNDALYLGACLEELTNRPGSQFSKGTFQYLIDRDDYRRPTRQSILDALDDLVRQFETARTLTADDLVCFLFAGHGHHDRNRGFRLLAQDTKADLSKTITPAEIHERLRKLPCPTLLLIDACHSAGVGSKRDLANSSVLNVGPQILVSSQSHLKSYECPNLRREKGAWVGHGLFTASVIEVLSGRQLAKRETEWRMGPTANGQWDQNSDSFLDAEELRRYLQDRVPELHGLMIQDGRLSEPANDWRQTPDALLSLTFPEQEIRLFQIELAEPDANR